MGAEIGAKIGAEMGAAEGLFTGILILSVIILSINMIFCLLRAVLGPRFSDRLIAINMIGTKTVLMIALLIKVFHEDYLVDICLIYALISFLSFVVLTGLLGRHMGCERDGSVLKIRGAQVLYGFRAKACEYGWERNGSGYE